MRARVLATLLLAAPALAATDPPPASFDVDIEVDARSAGAPLTPIWRFFGADEPNYATMKDGRLLLADLGALRTGDVYFRAHNLLSSGDGTPALKWGSSNVYTEDAAGNPRYDWHVIDGIFDAYLASGHGGQRVLLVLPGADLVVCWNDAKVEDHDQSPGNPLTKLNQAVRLIAEAVGGLKEKGRREPALRK